MGYDKDVERGYRDTRLCLLCIFSGGGRKDPVQLSTQLYRSKLIKSRRRKVGGEEEEIERERERETAKKKCGGFLVLGWRL